MSPDATTTIHSIPTGDGRQDVSITEQGNGHPFLVLHGGAGPQSVAAFSSLLANTRSAHVLTPTHPGFGGTPRAASLRNVRALAQLYIDVLQALNLDDVTVVGNSIGGWVAAEMALFASPRISGVVLVDAIGLNLPDHPAVDFASLTADQVTGRAYANPNRFRLDPAALPAAAQAAMEGNRQALFAYAGPVMNDPTLLTRLPHIDCPTFIVWGAADRIVEPAHGSAYADAIPGATLHIIDEAGHLPQIETPDQLADHVWAFADRHATPPPVTEQGYLTPEPQS